MILTQKHLPRRTLLRGAGAALALPLLDGMVPAFAATRKTAAAPVRRFAAVYVPMGANMPLWTPKQVGPLTELSPTLSTIEAFKDQMLVLSGLDMDPAEPGPMDGGGQHSRAQASWLTGVRAIAPANRSHLLASTLSCFLPFGVRR